MGLLELQLRDAGGFSIVSTDDAFHATAIGRSAFIGVLCRSIEATQSNEFYSTAQRYFQQGQRNQVGNRRNLSNLIYSMLRNRSLFYL
jgi:hypothetical protein